MIGSHLRLSHEYLYKAIIMIGAHLCLSHEYLYKAIIMIGSHLCVSAFLSWIFIQANYYDWFILV